MPTTVTTPMAPSAFTAMSKRRLTDEKKRGKRQ
jgi:hypothetical protein